MCQGEEYMHIRKAIIDEIDSIMSIYNYARKFMKENGNKEQWGDAYPSTDLIENNIRQKKFYVCMDENKIVGVFYFAKEEDVTYRIIKDGAWLNKEPYAVIHRIASAEGTKGAATFCLNWALEQIDNIRIDIHENNKPMQGLLNKLGYLYCGRINIADGTSRIAFHKTR